MEPPVKRSRLDSKTARDSHVYTEDGLLTLVKYLLSQVHPDYEEWGEQALGPQVLAALHQITTSVTNAYCAARAKGKDIPTAIAAAGVGLRNSEGVTRIGFMHYNSSADVNAALRALDKILGHTN